MSDDASCSLSALLAQDCDGWIKVGLTADTGACNSLAARAGPSGGIKILLFPQSKRGMCYGAANKETLPCLGARRREMWMEGVAAPRHSTRPPSSAPAIHVRAPAIVTHCMPRMRLSAHNWATPPCAK